MPRRDRTRLVRRGLLALVAVVSAAVVWGLRKPAPRTPPAPAEPAATGQQGTTTAQGAAFVRFREGDRLIEGTAAELIGQEGAASRFRGVVVRLPYGQGMARVEGEECLLQQKPLRASFRGKVSVRTDDGFELDSETLDYVGEPVGQVRSESPVRFKRGRMSGSASRMRYHERRGLQLEGEVRLQFAQQAGPPVEVEAATGRASREEGFVWLEGGVVVRQGARELRANRLQLMMGGEDFDVIQRAAAIEDVELRVGSGADLPGVAGGSAKRVRCRRLNVGFRDDGAIGEALAVNPGILELRPGPGDPPEIRRVSGSVLVFRFDEAGRLESLEGRSDGPPKPPEQQRAAIVTEPTAAGGVSRRVESKGLRMSFDPASSRLLRSRFEGSVVFREPGRQAWGGSADYDEAAGLVTLLGDEPRVKDEVQGGELSAREIRIATRTAALSASGNVRHLIGRRQGEPAAGLFGGDEPTLVSCREFEYDPGKRSGRYSGSVLIRSGRDEVRAPSVRIEDTSDGRRRLIASGGVFSRLQPRMAKAAAAPPALIEVRSRDLTYDERERQAVYSGDVEIRQRDILTKSPEARVLLTADGGAIDRVLVGSPVELRQRARRATGEKGTYTPGDETFSLQGEPVVLQDPERRISGRALTFQGGSDRIRVDGRDEVRPEAVFKRREPLKP